MKNKRIIHLLVLLFACLQSYILVAQTPPYFGTIFIEPGIITDTDCSTLSSVTYTGQGIALVYDRRVNNWVNINAYLFNVVWNDSLTSQAVVNPEFTIAEATAEANKYAFKIGQLPHCLRTDINEIWIHKGNFDWGGGNNSILIHTDRATYYESLGISEETLIHEASHTSLDAAHATSTGWIDAQLLDNNFISTYAQQNPIREDLAESYLTWLAVKHFASRVSATNYNLITQTIPNRLLYFDAQNFNLNPIPCPTTEVSFDAIESFRVYPNPTIDFLYINTPIDGNTSLQIYNTMGQPIIKFSKIGNFVDLSAYPNGVYSVVLSNNSRTANFRIIKTGR